MKRLIQLIIFLIPVIIFADSSSIWQYARSGELAKLTNAIVNIGIDINSKDNDGNTPLLWACNYGNYWIVKFLVDKKADLNVRNKIYDTPLSYSIKGQHDQNVTPYIIGLLLDGGVDITLPCGELSHACDNVIEYMTATHYNNLITWKLIANKNRSLKNPIVVKPSNQTIALSVYLDDLNMLQNILKTGKIPSPQDQANAAYLNYLDLLKYFDKINILDLKASVNFNEDTILHFAASGGAIDVANFLIEKDNTIVNVLNGYHDTPLHFAAKNGQLDMVKLLLTNHAKINYQDTAGYTPLMSACANYNGSDQLSTTIKFLIENGADINLTLRSTGQNQTALSFIDKRRYPEFYDYLVQKGAK